MIEQVVLRGGGQGPPPRSNFALSNFSSGLALQLLVLQL